MNYLIPAWTADLTTWTVEERATSQGLEFDDTINQARMFYQAGVPTTLLVPTYFPNYRHFALRQKLTGILVTNLFDYLQGIPTNLASQPLDHRDFTWPADADFVYTPTNILVYRQGHRYACLDHGQEGNLTMIEKFDATDQLQTVLWFDDRGFLSRVDDYLAGKLRQQNYLNLKGEVQLQVKATGEVIFLGAPRFGLAQQTYPNLTALMTTLFSHYQQHYFQADDRVLLAVAPGVNQTLGALIPQQQLISSVFRDRAAVELTVALAKKSCLTLVDQDALKQSLVTQGISNVLEVPPFDTRLGLGTSNQQKGLEIFWLVDHLSDQAVTTVLEQVLSLMVTNPLIKLTCGTYQNDAVKERLQASLTALQATHDWPVKFTFQSPEATGENQLEPRPKVRPLNFKFLNSENAVIQTLRPVRLILNLATVPDLFLQIAAISAGIPQILTRPSQYVEDGKNGQVIKSLTNLAPTVNYYLTGLRHWNAALMYATNQIQKYTGTAIVTKIMQAAGNYFPGNEREDV